MDDALVRARSLSERRDMGQFLTPWPIVETMVDWVRGQQPCQVVDVGSGTGRFAIAAGRALPNARIIAVDSDPVACLICRARVRTLGLANVEVHCADFLQDALPIGSGKTAYLGNPPYVRHHRVSPPLKAWAAAACRRLCIPFSALAGLHLYFFLAIALRGQPGDVGCLITSAEWLDVNYGRTLRRLLLERLGVRSVCVLDDSVAAFEDAMTSAAITCFEIGSASPSVCFSQVREFDRAEGPVSAYGARREALPERWRLLCRDGHQSVPCGPIARLGDLFSVHRGIATGANRFFVMSQPEASARGLQRFAHPVVTAGLEVLRAQGELDLGTLDRLILIPARIEDIGPDRDREAVKRWLSEGEKAGVPSRFLCRHRSPWWWLGNAVPPPLVASYMARRPPAFALNPGGALLLNIAHGLYPRHPMTAAQLRGAVSMLNDAAHTFVANGRCYQGGLVKFEPREMERLVIPGAVAPDDSPPPSPEESLVDAAQVAPGVHD
jgi:SAM-dependent methyltransferase